MAGVFVRMFIQQPTFPLADPAGLTKGLVSWIYSNAGHAWAMPGSCLHPRQHSNRQHPCQ